MAKNNRDTYPKMKGLLCVSMWAIALSACMSSKKQECVQILNTTEEFRQPQILGSQTQEAMLQNADLIESLAAQLESLPLRNKKLQEYREILVSGYRAEMRASRKYADMADKEGIVSVRAGDTAKQEALDQIQSERRKASNQIQLGFGQIGSFCSI